MRQELEMASQTTQRDGTPAPTAHDVRDLGRDVMRATTAYPWTSLFVLSAVVVGGSMLVAALLQDEGPGSTSRPSGGFMSLASAASGLGPKATETVGRIRDAAFSFALDRAIDTVDELFPGFREHYERG
jgi:hypothetical protein